MKQWVKGVFSDPMGDPSWFRVFGAPALACALFVLVWSTVQKYDTGMIWSSTIIISLFGAKQIGKSLENNAPVVPDKPKPSPSGEE
jgi:hypothetical protein